MSDNQVFRYTDAEIKKGGQLLKYPTTKLQKFMRFPFGLHLNHVSYLRSFTICFLFYGYLWHKIAKPLNTDANKEKYKKINEHRIHSRFDPIHE